MIELRGYIDENGNKLFASWLESLDHSAAAKVTIALTRMELGNCWADYKRRKKRETQ
jgi:hypothetical protein